jgi:hypothetical protein
VTRVVLSPTNVASYPEGGGHFWVYMQYATALRRLGCDVLWLERVRGTRAQQASLLVCLRERLRPFGMDSDVLLYTEDETGAAERALADAELFLNFQYDLPAALVACARRSALVDIDPGLLQHWVTIGELRLAPHHLYFTTGETIGTPGSAAPDCGLPWRHIRPPVDLERWPALAPPEGAPFTTVSSWMGGVNGEWVNDGSGGFYDNNKRVAFLRYLALPRLTGRDFELALCLDESAASEARARAVAYADYVGDAADRRRLEQNGWRVRHAFEVAGSPQSYQRYIQASRGEFSCVKPSCRRFRNAWISDRTLCYLATGRPAIVEDTGPSAFLPSGVGLLRFESLEEAADAVRRVDADYARHARAAREIAAAHFDATRVVAGLLEEALG